MVATLDVRPTLEPLTRIRSAGNTKGQRERDAVEAFLADLADDGVTKSTAERYVRHLGRFAAWLNGEDACQVGLLDAVPSDIQMYLAQLAASQKPASTNAALAALRRFSRWARAAGWIRTDPTRKVQPAAQQPLSPKGFSTIERRRLVREAERAGTMASAIVVTLLHTGVRVAELVGLRWEAVTLSPRAGTARVLGKGRKLRTVPLNATVREALVALRPSAQDAPTGAIFRGKRGAYSTRGIRDLLTVLGRRTGVSDVHPHRFRHDCARRLVASGVDLPTVAALLGHSNVNVTARYAQPSLHDLDHAVAGLETV